MIKSAKQVRIEVLETLVEQQAAMIDRMRLQANDLIVAAILYGSSPDGFNSTANERHEKVKEIKKKYLALQPCPEVLNRVRADAVRKAAAYCAGNGTEEKLYRNLADRIEKGEA
jgi:hypothetical protein